jgi:glycosyltransferase involved in cell wall biosynthesis
MERKIKRLAIIPAYNEQKNIGWITKTIRELDREIDVVIIDDGSSDDTVYQAVQAGGKVIKHSCNMGYGVALQTGYKYALERKYDYLVQLDGDGQHDPKYIEELFKVIMHEGIDLVLGSRFMEVDQGVKVPLQEHSNGMARKWGIRLFGSLVSALLRLKITDPTSGYQALNRNVIRFFTRDFFPCDYPDADVIAMVYRAGFKIKEVPMIMANRETGASMHSGLKPVYYVFKMFLSIFMTFLRKKPTLKERAQGTRQK